MCIGSILSKGGNPRKIFFGKLGVGGLGGWGDGVGGKYPNTFLFNF
jgi:hypothetical protein